MAGKDGHREVEQKKLSSLPSVQDSLRAVPLFINL